MLVLVHSAPESISRDLGGWHPNLGVLSSPRRLYRDAPKYGPWAADNDAFLAWDEHRYIRMVDSIREETDTSSCLFVTAPDVVGDADRTLELWDRWRPLLYGLPACLVAQDGLTVEATPWREITGLFIGGSTGWKLGPDAAELVREANRRGLWTHMGRVNTRQRFRWAKSIGCKSVDGTAFSRFRRTHLPWALEWAAAPAQLNLGTAA